MKPSPILCGRLKTRVPFTTKNVGRGFYRGTGTGALGAHTKYGNYLIDWRKVRHFVMPELKDFKLTPFVSGKIYEKEDLPKDISGHVYNPRKINGLQYLKWWLRTNPAEVDHFQRQEEALLPQEPEQEPVSQQRGEEPSTQNRESITPI